jgi:hypothetical protein
MWCAGGARMCRTHALPVASGLKLFVLKTEAVYSSESHPFIRRLFYLAYIVGHFLSRRIWLLGEPPTPDLSQSFLCLWKRHRDFASFCMLHMLTPILQEGLQIQKKVSRCTLSEHKGNFQIREKLSGSGFNARCT